MTPVYLRALQRAILDSDACMAVAVTPDMGKVVDAPARDKQVADILNAARWGATSRAVESWQAKLPYAIAAPMAREISLDPALVFAPRRIWVPVSAASGPPTLAAIAASNMTTSGARLTVT